VITQAVSALQAELVQRREPFVTATVVKVTRPTSASAGDVALVRADGSIEGFVGGVCAATSVRLYSLQAMEAGSPLLLRIMPDPEVEDPEALPISEGQEIDREPGAVTVRNPCLSGGAVEVFLEPVLPALRLLVAGESPIAEALIQLGPQVGFELVPGETPAPGDLGLVVAAHGRNELDALAAAVRAELPYIGLVASPKRGAAVRAELTDMGVDVGRLETPAGLDIGAKTAPEIALSILARVIEVRRQRDRARGGGASAPPAPAPVATPPTASTPRTGEDPRTAAAPAGAGLQIAVDPVCQMRVIVEDGTPQAERDGETFYFCCDGCQRSFAGQAG
jgi:xanthine dehydrogenase accessory factor